MANISDKVAQIREAIYGKEVRESIASGIEDINTEVESTTQRQTTLETDMADAKREAEEAAVRANTAAGDAEDITEALAVWEDYDPDADYIPMNKVVYQGSCYINIVACKGVLPTNQTNWLKIASKGLKGNTGAVPDISIGTVTTVAAGTSASVTRRAGSTDESPILDFDIPKGYDGEGAGDMTKFDYDSNNDGKVDAADIADSVPDNTITDAKLSDTEGQIKARFTSHLAETANKHIKESGSNANGNYIKFDDGTMICSSFYNLISETYIAGDYTYRWTFPANFAGRGYVDNIILTPSMQRGAEDMVKLNYFNFRISTDVELDGASVLLHFGFSQGLTSAFRPKMTAIGRWK